MSAFGYGAIRAVVKNSQIRYCMKCAQDKVYGLNRRGIVAFKSEPRFLPHNVDGEIDLRTTLDQGSAVSISGLLHEGQAGEQEKLDRLHCSTCKKLLRDDCTDY